jgi:thioredoxin-like negative regulator of GroEL
VWDFKSHPDEFAGRNKKPCVVVFSSAQSEPCQKLQPIIEAMQEKHKGQITFYSVDVEAEQALGNSFKIDIVPTVMLFPKDGQPQMVQGLRSQDDYEKLIDEL